MNLTKKDLERYPKKQLNQLLKIIKYGEEILNIDIQFINVTPEDNFEAYYLSKNVVSSPIIRVAKNLSTLKTIFALLHELGHHIDFIKRGEPEIETAAYEYYPEDNLSEPCPSVCKDVIIYVEEQAIKYSIELADYLGLSLPLKSFYYDIELMRLSLRHILDHGRITKSGAKDIKAEAKRRISSEYFLDV